MDERTKAISQTLKGIPLAGPMLAVMNHEGKTSGTGYVVEHVQPGRGFSCTEYSVKRFPNGHRVSLITFYPGPFDKLAGYPAEITETFRVWVAWEENPDFEEFDATPMALPPGADKWFCTAYDGPINWFACFTDGEAAEAYARSLSVTEDEPAPFIRLP